MRQGSREFALLRSQLLLGAVGALVSLATLGVGLAAYLHPIDQAASPSMTVAPPASADTVIRLGQMGRDPLRGICGRPPEMAYGYDAGTLSYIAAVEGGGC